MPNGPSLRESFREPEFRALAAAALLIHFTRLWEGTLDGDPVMYASVAKNIAESGNWFSLQLGYVPYWNKPPLLFWLVAPLFDLFGPSTFAARVWPAAFGVASILAVWRLGRELFDRPTAFAAAVVALATPELLHYASRLRFESMCVFFLVLALLDSVRAVRGGDSRRLVRVGAWTGLLFLAKGGPGLIALTVVATYLAWSRALSLLLTRHGLAAGFVMLGLGATWPALQWWHHGATYVDAIVSDLTSPYDQNAVLFYSWRLVRTYWVWLPFVALGVRELWRTRAEFPDAARLLPCWITLAAILISARDWLFARYLTSLYPAFALLAGFWLARTLRPEWMLRGVVWLPRAALAGAALVACLPYAIHTDDARPTRELDAVLRVVAEPGAPVPAYKKIHGFWRGQFHVYADRDVHLLPDLAAVEREAPPLVVALPQHAGELREAGWEPFLHSWRWVALHRPDTTAPQPPGHSESSSRRLE